MSALEWILIPRTDIKNEWVVRKDPVMREQERWSSANQGEWSQRKPTLLTLDLDFLPPGP
jgi:hypothetical protein